MKLALRDVVRAINEIYEISNIVLLLFGYIPEDNVVKVITSVITEILDGYFTRPLTSKDRAKQHDLRWQGTWHMCCNLYKYIAKLLILYS